MATTIYQMTDALFYARLIYSFSSSFFSEVPDLSNSCVCVYEGVQTA